MVPSSPPCKRLALLAQVLVLSSPGVVQSEGIDPTHSAASANPKGPFLAHIPLGIELEASMRTGLRYLDDPYGSGDTQKLGSEARSEIVLEGRIHPYFAWRSGILGTYDATYSNSRVALLDLVGRFEPSPFFNLWLGRIPIPSDRVSLDSLNTSLTWTPNGSYSPLLNPVGFQRGSDHRGTGATAWGHAGPASYYVGVFDPTTLNTPHLYSARVELQLLDRETGFFRSTTSYGRKNLLTLALSAQRQARDWSRERKMDDIHALGGEIYLEKNGTSAGVLGIDLSAVKMWTEGQSSNYHLAALISYLLPPEFGQGRFQPLFRIQYAKRKTEYSPALPDSRLLVFEGQLGYVLDGPKVRVLSLYQYGLLEDRILNLFLLGLQLATR